MSPVARWFATGAALAAVGASPAVANPTPVISPYVEVTDAGPPTVGRAARAFAGLWDVTPTSVALQWERCSGPEQCRTIPGAVATSYVPTTADVGQMLRVAVAVATSRGPGRAYSSVTMPVAAAPAPSEPPPPAAPTPPAATSSPAPPAPPSVAPPAPVAAPSVNGPASAPAPAGPAPTPNPSVTLDQPQRTRVGFGQTVQITGSVAPSSAGRRVEVRDPTGATHATVTSQPDGVFSATVAARMPGEWRISSDGATATTRIGIATRLSAVRASARVRAPGAVTVRGRISPPVANKIVELQYLDPRRGWRLWRQTRTEPGGRFVVARVLPRNPAVPAFTLRVRAAVPQDLGWGYLPTASRPFAVAVSS